MNDLVHPVFSTDDVSENWSVCFTHVVVEKSFGEL